MKCSKCGAELPDESKFCFECGEKIEPPAAEKNEEQTQEASNEPASTEQTPPVSFGEKVKSVLLAFWQKLDLFCKIETIAIAIVAILFVVSLVSGKILPIIFSVLQLGGLIVALLFHKERIKISHKWIKYLVLALAIAFVVLNISSHSWFDQNAFVKVNTPCDAKDCVGKDKDTVISDFSSVGFTNIEEEPIETLKISETDRYGKVESVSINGVDNFKGNQAFKEASKVVVKYFTYKKIAAPLSFEEAKKTDAETISKAFEDAGFVKITIEEEYDLDPDKTKVEFETRISIDGVDSFEKGEKFPPNSDIKVVTHRPYEKHKLNIEIDFIPNLIFSTYDVELKIGENTKTLEHGKDAKFEYNLKQGKYTLTFSNVESRSVKGTAEIDLTGDTKVAYTISCHRDKISVETKYIENQGNVGENEAMVPSSASDCKYENYKDIEKAFKKAGFSNIKTKILYDIVWGWTSEGEVDKVSVNGKSDFKRGDVFAKDAPVVITYHMKEEDDPNKKEATKPETTEPEKPRPVFYSTNDYETAKKGNTGVFSYKNKSGSYDVYWIVDFNEGYIYNFTHRNGEDICDKVKIVSGSLNDRITATWHDGGDQWSWYLHFKYENHPETLIVTDHNGFDIEFTTTDLSDALKIRDTKRIKEY